MVVYDDDDDDDPPLPEILDTPPRAGARTTAADTANTAAAADPSLAHDVANLFSALSAAFSAHPELSSGVRTLVRNAASGTYWRAHRASVLRFSLMVVASRSSPTER